MNARHVLDCPSLSHGTIVERVIFCRRGVENPTAAPEVLRYVDRFARGSLEPGTVSTAHADERVQKVFFVASGHGTLITTGSERGLRDGDGILVPAGVEHAFRNDGDDPLELLIVDGSVAPGAARGTQAIVRNFREQPVNQVHWSHFVHRLFGKEDLAAPLHKILVVRMEPMTTADTHGHDESVDEVWYMWRGCGVHVVDREVCVQRPGTAIQVAPSHPGHSLINHTEEPLYAFYVGGGH